jgi:hypothetical protein
MLYFFTKRRLLILAALFCVALANHALAQQKTLARVYDPVVLAAGKLAVLTNDTIEVFTAYRYLNGHFVPSRFQIDEVDGKGQFLRESDTIADTNDQVVFMPDDTGDRAPAEQWIDGSGNTRLELEVTDPLTNEKGWLYLFRHVKNPPKATPYVRYSRGPVTAGTDTVFATSYVEAHDAQGWFTDTRIRAPYGDDQDILDRQKVRADGRLFIAVSINEQDNVQYRFIRNSGSRPVRVLREYGIKLTFSGAVLDSSGSFFTQYFPFSTTLSAQNVKIPTITGLTVNSIRQSVDLNERAVGMKFFNAFNSSGITVDGVPDSPVKTITDPPDGLNWSMITGNQGSIVTLLNIPLIGTKRELYFNDNLNPNNDDTGDKKSYGDTGILVTAPAQGSSFSFDFTTYYVEKNQAVAAGDQFKQRALNPVQVTALKQTRPTSAVKGAHQSPTEFVLNEAQPNPFAPQQGQVRLSFDIGQTNVLPSLQIFNLLGQEVARFAGADLRRANAVMWDGRDRLGRLVPAGIYFYQLQVGRQRAVKKLVLLR